MSDPQDIPLKAESATRLPTYIALCKLDVFGRVEHLAGAEGEVARRVACGSRLPASRLIAHVLMKRERRALEEISGMRGVPRVVEDEALRSLPSTGELSAEVRASDVLLRSWCAGSPLHLATSLPEDFFERLADLVRELHGRGVCHNDLHKEQNVMVDEEGFPALIDFQLASRHRLGSYLHRVRSRDDLRHVQKHHRRYTRDGRGTEAHSVAAVATEKRIGRSPVAYLWRRLGKPVYVFVTRVLLRTKDGEERRLSNGPWPAWTPPVGRR